MLLGALGVILSQFRCSGDSFWSHFGLFWDHFGTILASEIDVILGRVSGLDF